MLKSFFLSEKKLLNAILRAKLNYVTFYLSNEMKCFFLQWRRQILLSLSFFAEQVISELNCNLFSLRKKLLSICGLAILIICTKHRIGVLRSSKEVILCN